jgi:hypothetical protein
MAEWSGGQGMDRPDDNDPERTRSPTTTGAEKTSGLTVARQEYNLDRGKRIDGSDRVQITPAADTATPENSAPTAPEQAKPGQRVEAEPSGDPQPDPTPEPRRGETSPSDTESHHNEPETVRRNREGHARQQQEPGQSDRAQITPIAPAPEAQGAEADVSPAEALGEDFHTGPVASADRPRVSEKSGTTDDIDDHEFPEPTEPLDPAIAEDIREATEASRSPDRGHIDRPERNDSVATATTDEEAHLGESPGQIDDTEKHPRDLELRPSNTTGTDDGGTEPSSRDGDTRPLTELAEGTDESIVGRAIEVARSVWTLPEAGGGANIDGRWYTEHALERMAPRTPQVLAELEGRALSRAKEAGFRSGTIEFAKWWEKNGPAPRNVPPMVVEAEIANPGSTSVEVVTNTNGDAVTVIRR